MNQQEDDSFGRSASHVMERPETPGNKPAKARNVDRETEQLTETIERLQRQVRDLHKDLSLAQRTQQTIGRSLQRWLGGRIWSWGSLGWIVVRSLGWLQVTTEQLVPRDDSARLADGKWTGTGLPQFLVPIAPIKGWIRVRATIRSSVASRACLYFDTGNGFAHREHFELGVVAEQTQIDRIVPVRSPTFLMRLDPIQHRGDFVLESFLLEPRSRLGLYATAVTGNLRKIIFGGGAHRPSIWIGLKLLLCGKWSIFRRQLVTNVESTSAISEYDLWRKQHVITEERRRQMREELAGWERPPKISVILPVYNVEETYLRACIDSVVYQIYPHWELCIADDASPAPHVKRLLDEYERGDSRIKVVYRAGNGNISAASNSALELATGEYLALLDHDDELAEHALYRMAEAIVRDRSLDMIYSDEDKLTPKGMHFDPFFKPDWSPEYFLACMYTCHLGVYRTELVKKVGGWRSEFDSSQDYDLVLRMVAEHPKVHHIPDVLYHWRTIPTSTAANAGAKPEAHQRAAAALQSYLHRIGRKGWVERGPSEGFHRIRYELTSKPLVSIIIPSACREMEFRGRKSWFLLECVSSIRKLSTYENLEIIVLDNGDMPEPLATALAPFNVRRVPYIEPFNLARKLNLGAQSALGEQFILLNDDVEVISPDWIQCMLEFSQWPEIGAVGAHLLFPNQTQQHTGVTLLRGNPGHPFYQFPADHPGYFNSSVVHRNWSAVTGACMMTRRDVFESVGGFSESFPLNYNDVDYCLKVLNSGKRIVYTPQAKLYHHESVSKSGLDLAELQAFHKAWGKQLERDPYYNPNLTMLTSDYSIGNQEVDPRMEPAGDEVHGATATLAESAV